MTDLIGQQLGKYYMTRLLGRGGYADVYLGEHTYLKTEAAIKVLHTRLEEDDIEKFRQEASIIANLLHPHIIRVLDFDVENGLPFLVMDYAAHGSVRQRHPKETVLTPTTFLPYIQQTASALQYAHEHKLVHRDIKPENMLLGNNDELLLSDFGIAIMLQSSHTPSTQDMIIGTMAYMAPEQIQGKPCAASDQYSLAIVSYEWLCGHRPFNGSFVEIVTQHLSTPPKPLDERALNIPHAIQQIIQKALMKDPRDRFPQIQDFADALTDAYQHPQRSPYTSINLPPHNSTASTTIKNKKIPESVTSNQPQIQTTFQKNPAFALMPVDKLTIIPPPSLLSTSAKHIQHGVSKLIRILLIGLLLLGLALCGGIYSVYHYFTGKNTDNTTSSTSSVDIKAARALAKDFMQALSEHNYEQAYNDLSNKDISKTEFESNAQTADQCNGPMINYKDSGIKQQNQSMIETFEVQRKKRTQPYHLSITLQKDSSGRWQIIDYQADAPAC